METAVLGLIAGDGIRRQCIEHIVRHKSLRSIRLQSEHIRYGRKWSISRRRGWAQLLRPLARPLRSMAEALVRLRRQSVAAAQAKILQFFCYSYWWYCISKFNRHEHWNRWSRKCNRQAHRAERAQTSAAVVLVLAAMQPHQPVPQRTLELRMRLHGGRRCRWRVGGHTPAASGGSATATSTALAQPGLQPQQRQAGTLGCAGGPAGAEDRQVRQRILIF